MSEYAVLGKRLPRVDALEKVTGAAQYGADVHLPGMLHGKFVRSKHPHARLLASTPVKRKNCPAYALSSPKTMSRADDGFLLLTKSSILANRLQRSRQRIRTSQKKPPT